MFTLDTFGPQLETLEEDESGDAKEVTVALHCILPCMEFEGLWENLVYDYMIKEQVCITFTIVQKHFDNQR